MSFFSAPPSQGRGVAADDVEKHATPCRGLILRKCLGEFGWGTWIRTRAARVRAESSTAKLSPSRRA